MAILILYKFDVHQFGPNVNIIVVCICSAQSKNRYNSGIVLRKVRILTLSADSGIVPDNSRIAQGIYVENR